MLPPMLKRLRDFLHSKGGVDITQEQDLLLAELNDVENKLDVAARKPTGRVLWEEFRRVQEQALMEVCDVPMSLCVCPTCAAATADSPPAIPASEPAAPTPASAPAPTVRAPAPATVSSPVVAQPSVAKVSPKSREPLVHPASPLKGPHGIRLVHPHVRP